MLLAVSVLIGLVAMWPGVQKIIAQEQKLAEMGAQIQQLGQEITLVKSENQLFRSLIPHDLQDQMTKMQDQAKKIEATVSSLGQQTRALTTGVLGDTPDAIQSRLSSVEGQVKANLTVATPDVKLTNFMLRMNTWQKDPQGRAMLKAAQEQLYRSLAAIPEKTPRDRVIPILMGMAAKDAPALMQAFAGLSPDDSAAGAMLLLLADLRVTLGVSQQPFDQPLVALPRLAVMDEPALQTAIGRLLPIAKMGIPNRDLLITQFDQLVPKLVETSLIGPQVSVSEKAQARLYEWFKLERGGQVILGTKTQKATDQARRSLGAGDFAGAIIALQSLEGAAAQLAAPWTDMVEKRLAAEKLQADLTRVVSANISVMPFITQNKDQFGRAINVDQLVNGLVESLGRTQFDVNS
jgi:hypothetical protein